MTCNDYGWRRISIVGCLTLFSCALFVNSAVALERKRGWAGGDASMADATNSSWYYNWWHLLPASDPGASADWIPLVKYPNNLQNKLDIVTSYSDVDTILVLNEPEREDQSDVTVTEAISIWPQFEATGLKLITPGVSDNVEGRNWLDDFMTQANANNYRMDGVAFHWYGADNPNNPVGAANSFLNRVDYYWNTYNLPVWVTEFAMHDWGGNYTDQEMLDANAQFLEVAVAGLESRSYVEAYSFYNWFDDSTIIEQQDNLWTPTNVGDAYIPSYGIGETLNINGISNPGDTVYLRGGQATNNGPAVDNAAKNIYAIEGGNDLDGTADWGTSGSGWVEVKTGATLRKTGNNTVKFNVSQLNNLGTLRVVSGGLSLEGGAQASGTGTFEVQAGGTLALGKASDRAGVSFEQNLDLHGGTLSTSTIADGTHVFSGMVTVHSTSTFNGDGLLLMNAPIAAPPAGGGGGIIKDGTGTLQLNNANSYEGSTIIKNGTLKLGFAASISPTPSVEVRPGGVLDVSANTSGLTLDNQTLAIEGQVMGSVHATNGSTVSAQGAANSLSGNLIVSNATVSVGGQGFNETAPPTPSVSTGLQLNFDAALDTANDATWTNAAAPANSIAFAGSATPDTISESGYAGITAAYDIATTSEAGGLNNYFEQQGPQRSQEDATFEVVFYVSDTAAGAEQVLFEVGATRGVSFTLSDNTLSFNVDGDGTTLSLSSTLTEGWHHAVGVVDLQGVNDNAANDSFELFVNGTSIGSSANQLIDDWAGGNTTGVGGNSAGTAGTTSPIDFHGKIAAARYYNDYLFSPEDVAQNFAALVGSGITMPSTMHIEGDYTQLADGTLEVDLLSTTMHDVLDVAGVAILAGLLDVGEIGGFDPLPGDSYTVLSATGGVSGEFDTLNLPALAGMQWLLGYSATDVTLSVIFGADFDNSGFVDSRDFLVWQRGFGLKDQQGNSNGDADGNGIVDANDLRIWKLQYGTSPDSQLSAVSVIPEPSAAALLCFATLGLAIRSNRNNRCFRQA